MTPDRYDPQGQPEVVHLTPPIGDETLPCCGEPTLRLPLGHRLTSDPERVTCKGKSSTEGEQ
jgi:hypothetical protein